MKTTKSDLTGCYPSAPWCPAERENIPLPPLRGTAPWKLLMAAVASRISGYGGIMNVFRMMLYGKTTFTGFMLSLNGRMSASTALSAVEKESLILYVTTRLGCIYEYTYHYRRARKAGLNAKAAENAALGIADDDRRAQCAYLAADSLLETRNIPDGLMQELKANYTPAQIYELIEIVGCYDMVAMIDNALEVPLEDGMQLTEEETR